MDEYLSSILILKCADIEPYHQLDFLHDVLDRAKRANMAYNTIN